MIWIWSFLSIWSPLSCFDPVCWLRKSELIQPGDFCQSFAKVKMKWNIALMVWDFVGRSVLCLVFFSIFGVWGIFKKILVKIFIALFSYLYINLSPFLEEFYTSLTDPDTQVPFWYSGQTRGWEQHSPVISKRTLNVRGHIIAKKWTGERKTSWVCFT